MITEKHYIKKQIIDVEISNKVEYWKLQKRLEEVYNEKIAEVLDEVCDRYAKSEEFYQLNKLEIDVGKINIKQLEEELPNKVKLNFEEKLALLIRSEAVRENKNIRKEIDPVKSKLDVITHFLETGRYKWPYDTENIHPDRILKELLTESPGRVRELFDKNSRNTNFIKRFIQQFTDENVKKVISLLEGAFITMQKRFFTEIPKILEDIGIVFNKRQYRSNIHIAFLELIGSKQNKRITKVDMENTLLNSLFIKNKFLSLEQAEKLIKYCSMHKGNNAGYDRLHSFFESTDFSGGTEYSLEDKLEEKIRSGKFIYKKDEINKAKGEFDKKIKTTEQENRGEELKDESLNIFKRKDLTETENKNEFNNEEKRLEENNRTEESDVEIDLRRKEEHLYKIRNEKEVKPDEIIHAKEKLKDKALKPFKQKDSTEIENKNEFDKKENISEKNNHLKDFPAQEELILKKELVNKLVSGKIKSTEKEFELLRKISLVIYTFYQDIKKELVIINQNYVKLLVDEKSIDVEILGTIKELLITEKVETDWKDKMALQVIRSLFITRENNVYELILAWYKSIKQKKYASKIFTKKLLIELWQELKLDIDGLRKYTKENGVTDYHFLKTIETETELLHKWETDKLIADDSPQKKANEIPDTSIQNTSKKIKDPSESEFQVEITEESQDSEKKDIETSEFTDCYIENAGIILLWPFISSFFKEEGLVEDNQFKNEACRNKAVYLLNYPISKTNEITENQLVLNKILCGFPVNDVLEKIDPFTKNEKKRVNKLVESALENWPVIKNTSLEGFINTFLVHTGVIRKVDKGWKLKVKRESFDMILDRLPWQLSIVKLPWMPKPIFVEW